MHDEVKNMIKNYDVVIIQETHFNERIRCPDGFTFEGRSLKVPSKSPRGGVAIYKNNMSDIQVELMCDTLRDCVIFGITHSDLVIAAQYIPPSNSIYYDEIYMNNLELIHEKYRHKKLLIVGDLNARVGTTTTSHNPEVTYSPNPDSTMNATGQKLLNWIRQRDDMCIVNGARLPQKSLQFDSDFTFFRGKLKSQNDLALTNDIDTIKEFSIGKKLIFSDHCPINITLETALSTATEIVYDCARNSLSDEHYDINHRLQKAIRFDRLNLVKVIDQLNQPNLDLREDDSNNIRATKISDFIYDSCKKSYKTHIEPETNLTDNLLNCSSSNFRAIAEANLFAYQTLSKESVDTTQYLENWVRFENLARSAANNELNVRRNKAWKDMKYDGKKLWETIDWNGRAEEKTEKPAFEADTLKYFTAIFNSEKTKNNPVVADIKSNLDNYDQYISTLDDAITMKELDFALQSIGTGVSIDGIPPGIAKVLPQSIKEPILDLMNRVFCGVYPDEWCKQILHSIKKDGHSPKNPKLRGIAIGPFLCRLYDIIMDNRFMTWFHPNKEQASQPKQGCPIQVFMLFLLIDYSKEKNKDLFVGFLDYEKAYDYVNRAEIISSLMMDGCGGSYTKAVAEMFKTSTYFPKSNKNHLSEGINTDHGVTQGRRSSGSFFSYYVSRMPDAVGDTPYDDFMDPLSLAQLADDTALYAEKIENLIKKFAKLFQFSAQRYQVPNISKTLYCNFSANPVKHPLVINDDTIIHCVDEMKGYRYLGMFFYPTNDILVIIERNFNKRMMHIAKFYGWLSVNEQTPIDVKLTVLDNCLFNALLYDVECMGDLSFMEKKLREIELKALKTILGVKKGTSSDLVFHELRRASIVAKIKDRQHKFYKKLSELKNEDAIVKIVIDLCKDSRMIRYYEGIPADNCETEISERESRITTSESSMIKYYREMELTKKCDIYSSMLHDHYRTIISRWRLSNHSLQVEVGRYTKPYTVRKDRHCTLCKTIEDEHHAIFICRRYEDLRNRSPIIGEYTTVAEVLNPKYQHMNGIGDFLHGIESIRKDIL